jgi:hypothetical protein
MGAVIDATLPAPHDGGLGGVGGSGGGGTCGGGLGDGGGSAGQVKPADGTTYFTEPVHGLMFAQFAVFHVVACIACDRRSVPSVTSVMYGSDKVRLPMTTPFVPRLLLVWSMKRNHKPIVSFTASGMATLPGMSTIWLLPYRVAFTAEIHEESAGLAAGARGRLPFAYAVPLGMLALGMTFVRLV